MSDAPGNYDGLKDYLSSEDPALLTESNETSDGVDKSEHNNGSRLVSYLLRTPEEQKIIQSPHQAEELLEEDVNVVVHMGCHSIRTPHIIDATVDIMRTLGKTVVPLGGFNNCCGILDFENGDLEAAEQVDDSRFRNIEAFNPDHVITECTSCFATTDKLSTGYRAMDGYEFSSMIEFLCQRQEGLLENVEKTEPVTIALHDHYDGYDWTPISEAKLARQLFEALPGVEIIEMEHSLEDALPCNFYSDPSQYEYDDLTAQVYQEATDAGVDYLVNFWHACHRNMAVYDTIYPIQTKNYATFIAERLGYSYRDIAKEYALAAKNGEIDWILTDAKPAYEANGLSESEAISIIKDEIMPKHTVGC